MDLFDVLDADRQQRANDAMDRLVSARVAQADAEGYRQYMTALQRQAGAVDNDRPKFDEAAFAAAKLRAKRGE